MSFFFALKEVCFTLSLEEEDNLPRCFLNSYSSLGKISICTFPFPFSIKNRIRKIFCLLYTRTQVEMELIITWFK